MRILLVALNAQEGDLDGNLAAHIAMLREAATQGCDVAVFPEFSLTGSVEPSRHPERAVTLDAAPVQALLEATWRTGVAAVFGIAERLDDRFHITQIYGHSGQLDGVYRKRHLGDDELSYRVGQGAGVFQLGSARFGVTICAEGGVDFPWTEAVDGGAEVIFFCSAPGLYTRRSDAASWRRGYAWWVSHGLGQAVRHARRLAVPVAMATQAGRGKHQDFPGLAALVLPSGEVARLPDGRAGSLVVEVAADVIVDPIREAVRCLIVDSDGRALLVRYAHSRAKSHWLFPPGGGLEPGEDHDAAIRRELREELGRDDLTIGPWIGRRCHTFWLSRWMTQQERWVLCRAEHFDVDAAHVALLAAEGVQEMRWWSAGELRSTGIVTSPRELPALLDRVTAGDLPDENEDLGV